MQTEARIQKGGVQRTWTKREQQMFFRWGLLNALSYSARRSTSGGDIYVLKSVVGMGSFLVWGQGT